MSHEDGVTSSRVETPPPRGEEQRAIRRQLDRLLCDPLFKLSKRYPALLRYIVETTLAGSAGHIKERTLGVEVFGRNDDYEPTTDPVVRVTAAEIRKKLAQYYQRPGTEDEIRIHLPLGSYVPEFQAPARHPEPDTLPAGSSRLLLSVRRHSVRYLAYVCLACAVVAVAWWRPWVVPSAADRFWAPVLNSPAPVLICLGQATSYNLRISGVSAPVLEWTDPLTPGWIPITRTWEQYLSSTVNLSTMAAAFKVAAVLAGRGKALRVKGASATDLADLKAGPVVLVGSFEGDWVSRVLQDARYYFDGEGPLRLIRDRQNHSSAAWSFDSRIGQASVDRDFAIFARIEQPASGQSVVLLSAFRQAGMAAAAEFISNPRYLESAVAGAPKNWYRRNIEVVIQVNLIHGEPGVPISLATHYW